MIASQTRLLQDRKKEANRSDFAKCGTKDMPIFMRRRTGYECMSLGQKGKGRTFVSINNRDQAHP